MRAHVDGAAAGAHVLDRVIHVGDGEVEVPAEHVGRLRIILAALDAAERAEDIDIHTFRPHTLKGDLKGFWSVTVRANWRVIFRVSRGHVSDVDLVDYH